MWFKLFLRLVCGLVLIALLVQCAPTPSPTPSVPTSFSSAERAVQEAKKYAGTTINVVWEKGLQAEDPKTYGPKWEALTGIKVNVVEVSYVDLYLTQIQRGQDGSLDVIHYAPAWLIDFVNAGVLTPLNPYIDKYMNKADLDDYLPPYAAQGFGRLGDQWYGLPDDGDVFILYYRQDLFEDQENQAAFKQKYGYDLHPPKNYQEFNEIGAFFTEKYAPDLYGGALQRDPGQLYSWFVGPFSGSGGQFFDPQSMAPGINSPVGVKVLSDLAQTSGWMPPDVNEWDFVKVLTAWLEGRLAMMISWPPIGRWSEGIGLTTEQLSWVPKTRVAGKVGYAPEPGGRSCFAGGFALGVAGGSKNKEAAYLFIQWMNSPEISLERVMLPYALRDPFRKSHFQSDKYRALWPSAGEYLDVLNKSALRGQYELGIPGAFDYNAALNAAIFASYAGQSPQVVLDEAAQKWQRITEMRGLETQKSAYNNWLGSEWSSPGPRP